MGTVLPLVPLAVLLIGGAGCAIILSGKASRPNLAEFFSRSVLLGSLLVSVCMLLFGFFISDASLVAVVTAVCLGLGLSGWRLSAGRLSLNPVVPRDNIARGLMVVVAVELTAAAWIGYRSPIQWDGLFIWEHKARLAFLAGGAVPIDYYSDLTRAWSHPSYPLLVSLNETWIYLWTGHPDPDSTRPFFLLIFCSGVAILYSFVKRTTADDRRALAAATAPAFLPLLFTGAGGIASGYADTPLATFYLAACTSFFLYLRSSDPALLTLAAVFSAALPWIKADGAVLSGVLALVAMLVSVRERRAAPLLLMTGPPFLVVLMWNLFLKIVKVAPLTEFALFPTRELGGHLSRLIAVWLWVCRELLNLRDWSVLWPLFFLLLIVSRRSGLTRGLFLAVVALPILLYSATYVFTTWVPYMNHVEFSMPRLILHTSLVAIAAVFCLADFGGMSRIQTKGALRMTSLLLTAGLAMGLLTGCARAYKRRDSAGRRQTTRQISARPIRTSSPPGLEGVQDLANCAQIVGWARDSRHPARRLKINVIVDGEIASKVLADGYRADLSGRDMDDGRHGFVVSTPAELRDGREHILLLTAEEGDFVLWNSPVAITCDSNSKEAPPLAKTIEAKSR